jgi:phosphohistidine phosphatase SixA
MPSGTQSRAVNTLCFVIAGILGMAGVLHSQNAQSRSGAELVKDLQQGGYVIVLRHASSPREAPERNSANADNLKLERQLDDAGRAAARAMGVALRRLKIPIGEVLCSPTYRAMETVLQAQLPSPKAVPELGDNGQSMQGVSESQTQWLKKAVSQKPGSGNTLLVTHMPNIAGAFPQLKDVTDGEALIFSPDSNGSASLAGRIKIEAWPELAR